MRTSSSRVGQFEVVALVGYPSRDKDILTRLLCRELE